MFGDGKKIISNYVQVLVQINYGVKFLKLPNKF